MDKIVTENIGDFGFREIKLLKDLLTAWTEQGLPDDFYGEQVRPAMNTNSGYVFLTNADYQVAMLNGDKLETWYTCPICGHEGFREDMRHNENRAECQEYLRELNIEV